VFTIHSINFQQALMRKSLNEPQVDHSDAAHVILPRAKIILVGDEGKVHLKIFF